MARTALNVQSNEKKVSIYQSSQQPSFRGRQLQHPAPLAGRFHQILRT